MLELKSLLIDSKTAWLEFPGAPNFRVEVCNLSRQELTKLRKRSTSSKFDRSTRQPVETLNEDKFIKEYSKAVVKNWEGLTLEVLETLILIDTTGRDLSEELPYTPEAAEILVNSSTEFDTWLNEVVYDLDNFRSERKS